MMKVKSDFCRLIAIELEKQDRAKLSRLIVELIREDRDLRRAILQVVCSSPNVMTEI